MKIRSFLSLLLSFLPWTVKASYSAQTTLPTQKANLESENSFAFYTISNSNLGRLVEHLNASGVLFKLLWSNTADTTVVQVEKSDELILAAQDNDAGSSQP
ncbi:MAG: hypothetical protein ACOYOK_07305 [Pseudobdellovibrionaceae bacterium]